MTNTAWNAKTPTGNKGLSDQRQSREQVAQEQEGPAFPSNYDPVYHQIVCASPIRSTYDQLEEQVTSLICLLLHHYLTTGSSGEALGGVWVV